MYTVHGENDLCYAPTNHRGIVWYNVIHLEESRVNVNKIFTIAIILMFYWILLDGSDQKCRDGFEQMKLFGIFFCYKFMRIVSIKRPIRILSAATWCF